MTIGLLFLSLFVVLVSCATDKTPLQLQNSIPENELAYYSDSFDLLREDVWEKAGHVFKAEQLASIKIADMTIEKGRLRIKTKTGGFSKGGLVSKFALRGDFDVQVDFQIDFVAGHLDMDQVLGFGIVEKTDAGTPVRLTSISLSKKGNNKSGMISGYLAQGKYNRGFWQSIDNFNGSVRFTRTGDQVSTFYRKKGQSRWKKMCALPSGQLDISIGFVLQNFTNDRTSITATRSIKAYVDNFAINAAQEIIESEI